ncbi:MAG: protein kinase family protein, partial [Stackebrandtia sp.]
SLAVHIDDDSSGRQVWRGMDVLLNRPVTVILRSPGGSDAAEMLSAAVAASRVNHPNIVGVYDAVDQGDCAYIVREWVEGQSLRDTISAGPLSVDVAVDIIQCVSTAVAAVHASGVAHGNIHPGTVLLSTDDRVVLTDPRADAVATQVGDVRALGATLYCAITGGWPRTVPGPASLADAPTDDDGQPLPPIEVRGTDVPDRLNRLIVDLMSAQVAPPTSAELAEELSYVSRVSDTGALALVTPDHHQDGEDPEPPARVLPPKVAKRRLAIGASALIGLAVVGLLAALIVIPSDDGPTDADGDDTSGSNADTDSGSAAPQLMDHNESAVQVLDPDNLDASASQDLGNVVDGESSTNWHTEEYNQENWGGYKKGMGLLLDLGEERQIATIQIQMSDTGNTVGVYAGAGDMSGSNADPKSLDVIVEPTANVQQDLNLTVSDGAPVTQYMLLWCSIPAQTDSGRYQWSVDEIKVYAQ